MDDNQSPGSPPIKKKKLPTESNRPARRDSPSKPGLPAGPQFPTETQDSPNFTSTTEEMSLNYDHETAVEYAAALPALISGHLAAPSLEDVDPTSVSLDQAGKGFRVLIPGSAHLEPGDEFNLLWGGAVYPKQIIDATNANQTVIGSEWLFHSPRSHLQQGKVEVCYDVYRNGQRIGTSAILYVNLHESYTTNDKHKSRKISFQRRSRANRKKP